MLLADQQIFLEYSCGLNTERQRDHHDSSTFRNWGLLAELAKTNYTRNEFSCNTKLQVEDPGRSSAGQHHRCFMTSMRVLPTIHQSIGRAGRSHESAEIGSSGSNIPPVEWVVPYTVQPPSYRFIGRWRQGRVLSSELKVRLFRSSQTRRAKHHIPSKVVLVKRKVVFYRAPILGKISCSSKAAPELYTNNGHHLLSLATTPHANVLDCADSAESKPLSGKCRS